VIRYLLCALCLFQFGMTAAAEPPRKNVVLLIADDLGLTLGCYGDNIAKTPHIDELAAAGTRFPYAFACVSSCSPSRATLYTGLHTHHSGQYGLAHATHNAHTLRNVQSLPKLLNAAGYRTAIIGKLHVQPKEVYPWQVEIGGGRDVPLMSRQARKFIEDSGDKPFFLVMGYTDPHRAAKGFGNDRPVPNTPHEKYDPKSLPLPYFMPDAPDARADLADYYTSATRLDHGVGLVMNVLKELNRENDTLVIFLSDNGIPFPGAKTTLYDSGLNLPLIVKAPGRKPGVCNGMASWIDIAPTILAWAGVKQPAAMIGRSLLPILEREKPEGWDEVFGSHQFHEITMYYPMRMLRTRTHKLILNLAHQLPFPFASDIYYSGTWQGILKRGDEMLGQRSVKQLIQRPREELYDLAKDPNELKNVAGDPNYSQVLDDLRKRLKAWQERTQDPWLVKYKYE
jgi:N-sulfoglucosamine sulfohydrolase